MKQLKFFTKYADTLKATQAELSKHGVEPKRLHVFVRDNVRHRYDGLILHSDKGMEQRRHLSQTGLFALLFIAASLALYYSQLTFVEIALAFALLSTLPYCLRFIQSGRDKQQQALKKVYFLVVDVNDDEDSVVNDIVKHHPDLLPQ